MNVKPPPMEKEIWGERDIGIRITRPLPSKTVKRMPRTLKLRVHVPTRRDSEDWTSIILKLTAIKKRNFEAQLGRSKAIWGELVLTNENISGKTDIMKYIEVHSVWSKLVAISSVQCMSVWWLSSAAVCWCSRTTWQYVQVLRKANKSKDRITCGTDTMICTQVYR